MFHRPQAPIIVAPARRRQPRPRRINQPFIPMSYWRPSADQTAPTRLQIGSPHTAKETAYLRDSSSRSRAGLRACARIALAVLFHEPPTAIGRRGMANPNGAVPRGERSHRGCRPSAVNAAQLDQLLRAVGELTNMVHSQQRQIDSLAGEVPHGRAPRGSAGCGRRFASAMPRSKEEPPLSSRRRRHRPRRQPYGRPGCSATTSRLPAPSDTASSRSRRPSARRCACGCVSSSRAKGTLGTAIELPSHHQHQRDSHAATRVQAIQRGRA